MSREGKLNRVWSPKNSPKNSWKNKSKIYQKKES